MELRLLDIAETPRSDIAHSTARLERRCNHVAVDGRNDGNRQFQDRAQ